MKHKAYWVHTYYDGTQYIEIPKHNAMSGYLVLNPRDTGGYSYIYATQPDGVWVKSIIKDGMSNIITDQVLVLLPNMIKH